jgi:cytosine deaminase
MNLVIPQSGEPYLLRQASVPVACFQDLPADLLVSDDIAACDLLIVGGRIADLGLDLLASSGFSAAVVELDRGMVWPGFVDIHTHLDKGHIWPRRANPDGTFMGALEAAVSDSEVYWTAADLRARMEFSLKSAYAHGSVLLRTHLDSSDPLYQTSWPLYRALKAEWAGRLELQAVSLLSLQDAANKVYFNDLCDHIVAADGVLGAFTYPMPDLAAVLDRFFQAATSRGLDLDFHVDETADAASDLLRHVAEASLRNKFQGRVLCGHCCSLARQEDGAIAQTLDLVAKAGISVVSLPMCNMYLQDRHRGRTPRWRGVTLLQEMAARGIPVALASDNVRDPFYAYGDLDMLEVYREATRIAHLDHPVAAWPGAVTRTAADIVGRADYGRLQIGAAADLILFRARHWSELLSRPQADRMVLRSGAPIDTKLPDYRELDELFEVTK